MSLLSPGMHLIFCLVHCHVHALFLVFCEAPALHCLICDEPLQPLSLMFSSLLLFHSAKAKPYIASMGIYVMSAKALKELLLNKFPDANDFGNEVIPGAKDAGMKVQAFAFQGGWYTWAHDGREVMHDTQPDACMHGDEGFWR